MAQPASKVPAPFLFALFLGSLSLSGALSACAANGRASFDTEADPTAPAPAASPAQPEGAPPDSDFGTHAPETTTPPEVSEVFGHSGDTLYRLDPDTKAVTVVGKFQGCQSIVDIALDETSNIYGTSYTALFRIDKETAACTEIAKGTYPNSLSFVPKGTLDPTEEVLVGYDDGDYIRIDPKTGSKSKVGQLGGELRSSGDIVSVKGGATFLTVKGGSCTKSDCLVEVDPKTGKITKNWGSVGHSKVYGLSFWAGSVYGFDDAGELFEVTFANGKLKTTPIPIPDRPADLQFWGAGSTTSAPLVATPK